MSWWRSALASRAAEPLLGIAVRRRQFEGVAVLCYHAVPYDASTAGLPFAGLHVPADIFEDHCRVLSRYCSPISLAQWEECRAGVRLLPPRAVLVTFDDGYRSVATAALPILQRYRVPAVVCVSSEAVERGELFWFDAVALADGESAVGELKGMPYEDWHRNMESRRRATQLEHPAAPLSVDEVTTLAAEDLIDIAGHTHTHPMLKQASPEIQRAEVRSNLDRLAAWTGTRPHVFAYPNGQPGVDFDHHTVATLKQAGITCALTTSARISPLAVDPLQVPRFVITRGLTADKLLHRLARVWH